MTAQKAKKAAAILCVLGIVLLGISMALIAAGMSRSGTKAERTLDDYLAQGRKYYERGDYKEAILTYDMAAELDENNPEIMMGLGMAYANSHYYDEAEKVYQDLLNLDETNAEACLELAQVYLSQGKLEECRVLLETMSGQLQNDDVDKMYAQTLVDMPEFSLTSGSYDQYQLLELTSIPAGSVVCYTLNGEEPTRQSDVFTDGLVISSPTTTFCAKAFNSLGYSSDTVTLNLEITVPVEEIEINDYEMRYALENICGSSGRGTIYNYQLAQIQECYLVGEEYWYDQSDLAGVHFYADSMELWEDRYYQEGMIQDLTVLKYCPFLKSLNIAFQPQISLNGIENLTSLESLSIMHSNIRDISNLASLSGLKQLSLGWNQISDLSPLSGLTKLQTLGLWGNDITDISPLTGLTELYYLDISDNMVSDIQVVQNMPYLSEFWMYGNSIADLSDLDGLTELQVLIARDNPIDNYGKIKEKAYDMRRLELGE